MERQVQIAKWKTELIDGKNKQKQETYAFVLKLDYLGLATDLKQY